MPLRIGNDTNKINTYAYIIIESVYMNNKSFLNEKSRLLLYV